MIRASIRMLVGTMALTMMACQVDRAQAQTKAQDSELKDVVEHQVVRLDVDFPGGKIIDYIETIRRAFPKGAANIVVMPNAQAIEVPPISLVAVTVEAAVSLLEGAYTLPNGRRGGISVDAYRIEGKTDKVFKLSAYNHKKSNIVSKVWSLEQVLSGDQSERELLGAIDVVQSLFSNRAEIKYHPPTRLLIARGTAEQLLLAGKVIGQLIGSTEHKRERIENLNNKIESMLEQQHEYSAQLIDMDDELQQSKLVLEEEGLGDPDDRDYMIGLRSEVKRNQMKYDSVKGQLDRINNRLKKAQNALTGLTEPS